MTYIVLELFSEPFILTNMDGEVWKTDLKTARELASECQEGMIVPLHKNLMIDLFVCWYDCKDSFSGLKLNKYFNDINP